MNKQIIDRIEHDKTEIINISHDIHGMPELGFEEFKASKRLCDYLEGLGFQVERGIGKFETAFVAKLGKKTEKGVTVAILAEYDALPKIGHACGHNIIAAAACGVASGFSQLLSNPAFDGELHIIGTPAEESGGGKIELLKLGIFEDVNYAMMVHPSSTNMVHRGGTALVAFHVAFEGKNAHSSSPENGINALKALICTFNGIDAIQGEFPMGININGIIREGGDASNIIPDKASGEFLIRGLRLMDLKIIKEKLIRVVKSAEILTGAKANYSFELPYAERYPNHVMGDYFKMIMEELGESVSYPDKNIKLGSSDIGNVSLCIPTIHPYVKIGDDLYGHTLAFTAAAIDTQADDMLIKASKAMAELTYRIFVDETLRNEINHEFKTTVPDYKGFEF